MADTSVKSPDDVVDFLIGQHERIKGIFDETLSASGSLREAVIDHAEHEEHEEFSKLLQELTDDELGWMTRTVKLAESIAPTRPHAGVESRLANLFTGPFAAMMDRARDAILGYS